ncbi:MAG TPA: thioesterase family protein [Candidatus Cloacimonadota bacterium]|nr:thioesterase family protein [Candidatus Cloacimonadota bacterium]HPT71182.1 thioesterase family protein [Candidatus Cloacimonadota bacterium]
MVFSYHKRIYGYECDSYGHMNNASYLQMLEAARSEALIGMNMSINTLRDKNIHIYLNRLEIDFKKGLKLEEQVTVKTWIEKGNRLRAIWMQEVFNSNDELCCRASIFGAFVKDGRPHRLSPEEYEIFVPFVKNVL